MYVYIGTGIRMLILVSIAITYTTVKLFSYRRVHFSIHFPWLLVVRKPAGLYIVVCDSEDICLCCKRIFSYRVMQS